MTTQVARLEFREAMARVCAPVNIVTTDGPAGRGGFTATAMCSVSDDPPTLLVCMNERSAQTGMFLANQRFCVNVLTQSHMHLAAKFAGAMAIWLGASPNARPSVQVIRAMAAFTNATRKRLFPS